MFLYTFKLVCFIFPVVFITGSCFNILNKGTTIYVLVKQSEITENIVFDRKIVCGDQIGFISNKATVSNVPFYVYLINHQALTYLLSEFLSTETKQRSETLASFNLGILLFLIFSHVFIFAQSMVKILEVLSSLMPRNFLHTVCFYVLLGQG